MDNPWLILFPSALAAGFLPWQFSAKILILRKEQGLGRAAAFAGGITFWRLVIGIVLAFVLAGGLIVVGKDNGPVLEFIRTGFEVGAERVKNRQNAVLGSVDISPEPN